MIDVDISRSVWAILALCQLATEPHAIGHLCQSRDCTDLARWLVPWPGQGRGRRCDRHMHAAVRIAESLGFDLAGVESLELGRVNVPEEDPAVARFAAMELV